MRRKKALEKPKNKYDWQRWTATLKLPSDGYFEIWTRATDDVDSAVADVCADLVKGHPQSLAETKALLAAPMLAYLDANADEMAALSARLFGSDSAREAMLAFLSGVKSHK